MIVSFLFAGWISAYLVGNREPRYDGRSLSEWLKEHRRAEHALLMNNDPEAEEMRRASTNAIMRIGKAAVPFLVEKVAAKDSRLKLRLNSWLDGQKIIRFRLSEAYGERSLGMEGIYILGKDAAGAAPSLLKLTGDPDDQVRWTALCCLSYIKPKQEVFLPILLQTVHDPATEVRILSADMMHRMYPKEAEKIGIIYQPVPDWAVDLGPWKTNNVSTNAPLAK